MRDAGHTSLDFMDKITPLFKEMEYTAQCWECDSDTWHVHLDEKDEGRTIGIECSGCGFMVSLDSELSETDIYDE